MRICVNPCAVPSSLINNGNPTTEASNKTATTKKSRNRNAAFQVNQAIANSCCICYEGRSVRPPDSFLWRFPQQGGQFLVGFFQFGAFLRVDGRRGLRGGGFWLRQGIQFLIVHP